MQSNLLQNIKDVLSQGQNLVLSGLSQASKSYFLQRVQKIRPQKTFCLVPGEEKAYDLQHSLQAFVDSGRIALFPGRDFIFVKENYSLAERVRISTLRKCLASPRRSDIIICTPLALLYKIMSPACMADNTLTLEKGREFSLEPLLKKLFSIGYRRTATVNQPGEFAVRGGVLDIYPAGEKHPTRLEFFGDVVDSMRCFDAASQRSIKSETIIHITPADELAGNDLTATLFDYAGQALIFCDEPRDFMKNFEREAKKYREAVAEARREEKELVELPLLNIAELRQILTDRKVIYHSFFPGNIPQVKAGMLKHISQQEMEIFYGDYERLFTRIREWQGKNYRIELAVKNKKFREKLQKDLSDRHISGIVFTDQVLEHGFVSSDLNLALVGEQDILGKVSPRRRKTESSQERLILEDLAPGDYVVHETYGIGIFRGVSGVDNDGNTREYILLQYAGTDRLYLPLEKLDVLYKYTSTEEKPPRLSKLGGSDWEKTKNRVSRSIQEMAESLLALYAARQAREGFAFSSDTPWQRQFEDEFPFQETADQARAIIEVKKDMEKTRPMDRLICGDVGYGKTEVAMRAAFKAVMDGKQVAVLVPTTVLAEQHYYTFKERFYNYPAEIEVLSRFRSTQEQKQIAAELKKGLIDIVIGTHRLLSRDVQFKDLGLLVVDEEHRFGVAQKEKIKSYKELVDVISLSATPIPRSLHMSLTGLRDLSVIETPPSGRYPVTTYVMEYNDHIIMEAIKNEVKRKGQVFFVHNRIEDIYRVKKDLEERLPGISIVVGHGRMKEEQLARDMSAFAAGKYDLLLCTTIIESGLDMPNVNTIIIDEADKMGLAQLYQLRGRVGRSNRMAYAYLTYHPQRVLNETAQKRLNAIREFNELGAGMKIALRDLEIRGAGNVLGPEQHGYIQAVGFDLYCRLLEKETARLKGSVIPERVNPLVDIDIDYYIPDNYIPDSGAKIRIYRRLLLAADRQEVEEIRQELRDRFGLLPAPVENFLKISILRILARDKKVKSLRRKGHTLELQLHERVPSQLMRKYGGRFRGGQEQGVTLLLELRGNKSLQSLQEILESL